MDILGLISQTIGLADTVLRYVDKNRDHSLKKKVFKLMRKIQDEESKLPEDRDDQLIVSYYDELAVFISVFKHNIEALPTNEKSV